MVRQWPHCKNSNLIIWLQKSEELTGVKLTRFSNFEAQKSKTKLDSLYATLKLELCKLMKRRYRGWNKGEAERIYFNPIDINWDAEAPSA